MCDSDYRVRLGIVRKYQNKLQNCKDMHMLKVTSDAPSNYYNMLI